jgi:hypothetical protein
MDIASLTQAAQDQTPPNSQAVANVASLVKQAQPRHIPTHAQTVAALHRFREIESAVSRILKSPDVGRKNVRPKVLEMGGDLIGSKVMSLAEFMKGLQTFPAGEDPLAQKKWLERLYQTQIQGQMTVLQDRAMAQEHGPDDQWSPETHDDHWAGMMKGYNL